MTESAQQFIERMGLIAEEEGFPRISGRILGLLLVREEPFSLDQLAETLQVSKASISTNARLLEQLGVLERISSPGDRRDFYRLGEDPWKRMFEVARRRLERMHDVLTEGQRALAPNPNDGCRRIQEWRGFYAFLLHDLEGRIERWHTRKGAPLSPAAAESEPVWGD